MSKRNADFNLIQPSNAILPMESEWFFCSCFCLCQDRMQRTIRFFISFSFHLWRTIVALSMIETPQNTITYSTNTITYSRKCYNYSTNVKTCSTDHKYYNIFFLLQVVLALHFCSFPVLIWTWRVFQLCLSISPYFSSGTRPYQYLCIMHILAGSTRFP